MRKAKPKRADETGIDDRGRHTFHRHESEVIAAYLRVKIHQYQTALDRLRAILEKGYSAEMAGQRDYFASAVSLLTGMYRQGTRSVDADDWHEAWTHITTVARHGGADTKQHETKTIPGME